LKGTGGAIREAINLIRDKDIIVLNGDSFCYFDIRSLTKWHIQKKSIATLTLLKVTDPDRFGIVSLDENNYITRFREKDTMFRGSSYINAGVYVLNERLVSDIDPSKPISLEIEVLPKYIKSGMQGFLLDDDRFIDIGTPESLEVANFFFDES